MKKRRAAAALLTASLLTALVGCGSGSSGGKGAASSRSAAADTDDMAVKYVNCLRKHGVKAQMQENRVSVPDVAQDKLNAAQSACKKYSPKGDIDANAVHDQDLAMARCLRQHGVDVKDPQPGESLEFSKDIDKQKAEKAQQTCHKEVAKADANGDGQ